MSNFFDKMDLAKLHLLNGDLDHDNGTLLMEIIASSCFHTNIAIIEYFRRESVLR